MAKRKRKRTDRWGRTNFVINLMRLWVQLTEPFGND